MGDAKEQIFDVLCRLKGTDSGKCYFYGDLNLYCPLLQNYGNWQIRALHLALQGQTEDLDTHTSLKLTTDFVLDHTGKHVTLAVFKANELKTDKCATFDFAQSSWLPLKAFKGSEIKVGLCLLQNDFQPLRVTGNTENYLLLRLRVFTSVVS
jgi:hypothetical protein